MRAEISRLHKQLCVTSIYVTHDQAEAMIMGDRIAVMKQGRIQQVGNPFDLYWRPSTAFVAGFIGPRGMNFFQGTLLRVENDACFVEASAGANGSQRPLQARCPKDHPLLIPPNKEGQKVILGVRPEHIQYPALTGQGAPVALDGVVECIEPAGHESYIHLRRGEGALIARAAGQVRIPAAQTISLSFDIRQAHFFDALSGEALPCAS